MYNEKHVPYLTTKWCEIFLFLQEGHKWLDSEHRWNDVAPANLAWETIEDILTEKIEEHWKAVSAMYRVVDPAGTGAISRSHLKKILNRCVLPVADDHLEA